ncbi:MAG: hypothetical protein JXL80_17950 [Planctomycetes bacterium]|nr:hypothetical protein [Planctomycetota bacterium]
MTNNVQADTPRIAGSRRIAGPIIATLAAGAAFLLTFAMVGVNAFLVPKYRKIFEDFDTSLPKSTELIISLSNFTVAYGVFVVVLIVLLLIALIAWIWCLDWRSGLAASILLAIFMVFYGACTVLFIYLPIVSLIRSAGSKGGP